MTRLLLLLCLAVGCVGQQPNRLCDGGCMNQQTIVTTNPPIIPNVVDLPPNAHDGDCFKLEGRELRKVECGNEREATTEWIFPSTFGWALCVNGTCRDMNAQTIEVPLPEQIAGSHAEIHWEPAESFGGLSDFTDPPPMDVPAIESWDDLSTFTFCPDDITNPHRMKGHPGLCYAARESCPDKRRILIGPDGYGAYWCHMPQKGGE